MSQESPAAQTMRTPVQPVSSVRLGHRFRLASVAGAAVVLLFAVADIIGWALDIKELKHPFGSLPSLQSGTSITLLFTTAALLMLSCLRTARSLVVARIIGGVILTVGGLNLAEHLSGHDWGLSYPLYSPPGGLPLSFPGPMAPDVAVNFILFGLALLLAGKSLRGHLYPFQLLALLVALPNIMILCSYAAGEPHMCAYFGCVRFSPVTSLALTLASLSFLFMQVETGITRIFACETTGGRIMRRAAGGLIALIPLLWFVRAGEAIGLYEATVSGGITILMIVCLLGGCMAWGARKVDSIEAEKTQAVELLQDSIAMLSGPEAKDLKAVCLRCAREFDDLSRTHCPDDGTQLSRIADKLKMGSVFADRYEVLSLLGVGGISTVYLVRHMHMDKKVALKLLHAHFATETRYVQRFQREALATSKLSSPNIVGVYDFGISLEGEPYLIMEYLDGKSLEEMITTSGAVPWKEAVPIFMQICEGLEIAHSKGIIHRDLKPANIMLVQGPIGGQTAKIVDFGLARADDAGTQLTATGDVLGSPTYMSPEQCRGETVDSRSDIYSLGSLMYDCLAGQPAFTSENVYETITMQTTATPPAFPAQIALPPWLVAIVFHALEKSPLDRPQSIAELLHALEEGMRSEVMISGDRVES